MIKVVAKNFAKEENVGKIIELCEELVRETRKEEGCYSYSLYMDSKDKTILTFIEEWEDKDALKRHLKTEHFTKIFPKVSELMAKDAEMNIYNLVY